MKDKKISKTTVQWIFSVLFILIAISSISKGICFIFFLLFGLLINPKFPQIYFKLFKKNIGSVPRVIACVVAFLLIGVTSPKSNKNDTNQTANLEDTSAITTTTLEETTASEDTTITTTKLTTITTIEETELTTTVLDKINPLVDGLIEDDVKSGSGKIIGKCAYVKIDKSKFNELTTEQFLDFCNNHVKDSGYNWVSIIFEDETGICFVSSSMYIAEYGVVDKQGSIVGAIFGDITINDDNTIDFPKDLKLSNNTTDIEETIITTTPVTTTEKVTTTTIPVTTTEKVTTTTIKETEPPKIEEPQQNDNQSRTVYITPTGKKYHYDSKCGNGTYNPISLDEAIARGYEPCKKCT